MVDLLNQAIDNGLANWEACHASIEEIKKDPVGCVNEV
ncbi:MAG: hypothetical protein RLZZ86_2086 [Cyanobacteriota bacterium]|jgi:hypothetical protein